MTDKQLKQLLKKDEQNRIIQELQIEIARKKDNNKNTQALEELVSSYIIQMQEEQQQVEQEKIKQEKIKQQQVEQEKINAKSFTIITIIILIVLFLSILIFCTCIC